MISGINPAATPGTSYRWNHTGRFSNSNSVIKGKADDPAATLTISPEGLKELREKLRELREPKVHTMDSYRRMLEGEKRINAVFLKFCDEEEERLKKVEAMDPFNNPSGLYDDSYAFYEEDVTSYVERNLTGKVSNVSLIAKELERLVHGDDGRGTDRLPILGKLLRRYLQNVPRIVNWHCSMQNILRKLIFRMPKKVKHLWLVSGDILKRMSGATRIILYMIIPIEPLENRAIVVL